MDFRHLKTDKPDYQTDRILAAFGLPVRPAPPDQAELEVLAWMDKNRRRP